MYEIFYRTEPYLSYTNIQVAIQLILNKLKLQFPQKILINKKKYLQITKPLKNIIESCTSYYYTDRMNTQSIHTCLLSIIKNTHNTQFSDLTSINSFNISVIHEEKDDDNMDEDSIIL
mmetsp:Transcript_56443/g.68999  ORF Transcript_56443/g.68999 Transcript_56443/m.68999 type:complete len:118 (+) Transcript_56443:2-355(+)